MYKDGSELARGRAIRLLLIQPRAASRIDFTPLFPIDTHIIYV